MARRPPSDGGIRPSVKRRYLYSDSLAGWDADVTEHALGFDAVVKLYVNGSAPVKMKVTCLGEFPEFVATLHRLGAAVVAAGESLRTCKLDEP